MPDCGAAFLVRAPEGGCADPLDVKRDVSFFFFFSSFFFLGECASVFHPPKSGHKRRLDCSMDAL